MRKTYIVDYSDSYIRGNIGELLEDYNSSKIVGLCGGINCTQNRVFLNRFNLVMFSSKYEQNRISNGLADLTLYNEENYADDDEDEGDELGTQANRIKDKYFGKNAEVVSIGSLLIEFSFEGKIDCFDMCLIYFGLNNEGKVIDIKLEEPYCYNETKVIKNLQLSITIELLENQMDEDDDSDSEGDIVVLPHNQPILELN